MRKHLAGFQYRLATRAARWLRRLERHLEPVRGEYQADEPHPYQLGTRGGEWRPYGCVWCSQKPGADIHNPALAEEYIRATGRAVRRAQGREP